VVFYYRANDPETFRYDRSDIVSYNCLFDSFVIAMQTADHVTPDCHFLVKFDCEMPVMVREYRVQVVLLVGGSPIHTRILEIANFQCPRLWQQEQSMHYQELDYGRKTAMRPL
jgi:hypothetical protein